MSKKYVNVWRLENDRAQGPWACSARWQALDTVKKRLGRQRFMLSKHDPSRHSGPSTEQYEFIKYHSPGYDDGIVLFGCHNLKQFRKWFSKPFRRGIAEVDPTMKLKRYRVPEPATLKGNMQIVFVRKKAKLIETRSVIFDLKKKKTKK